MQRRLERPCVTDSRPHYADATGFTPTFLERALTLVEQFADRGSRMEEVFLEIGTMVSLHAMDPHASRHVSSPAEIGPPVMYAGGEHQVQVSTEDSRPEVLPSQQGPGCHDVGAEIGLAELLHDLSTNKGSTHAE